jgi:hypothetical protein
MSPLAGVGFILSLQQGKPDLLESRRGDRVEPLYLWEPQGARVVLTVNGSTWKLQRKPYSLSCLVFIYVWARNKPNSHTERAELPGQLLGRSLTF